ncbi:hypothetical protein [Brevibacillus sp. H7]|uniref:hypothetical protein n=1 Tax=Brevibacillus sp. H7 TaxID=3349138 RepID=UPI00380F360F
MREYERVMEELRLQIEQAAKQLRELEAKRDAYEQQRKLREHYLSSREILQLLSSRHGRTGSWATIKRWADEGHLGDVLEERVHFPLLAATRGKKRFLYSKRVVYGFLHQKGLLRPAYDILDRVRIKREGSLVLAVVTSAELMEDRFVYSLQIEGTAQTLTDIAEGELAKE